MMNFNCYEEMFLDYLGAIGICGWFKIFVSDVSEESTPIKIPATKMVLL